MKERIAELLARALRELQGKVISGEPVPDPVPVERTRDPQYGDFASNIALLLAKPVGLAPRKLAEAIRNELPDSPMIAQVEIAGPGFINFHLAPAAYREILAQVLRERERYGRSEIGAGTRVLVEFVSANPTGPLHVGHGRHAAYGATVANLLSALGYDVEREYYVNDAGRQMDILTLSVWLRYLEQAGEQLEFPASGYRGEYVAEIAASLHRREGHRLVRASSGLADLGGEPAGDEAHIDAMIARARSLLGPTDYRLVQDIALDAILEDIRSDLAEFGVTFDRLFSERELREQHLVQHALERLEQQGHVYRKDGALWLRASDLGDDKDRVVVRENGEATYFASDIAYHLNKRERGYDLLLDVLGADHHGYVARVRAGLEAMGEPGDCLEVRLMQFVALYRGSVKVPMSTRSGQFVTLRELRAEVGTDASRLFYVSRSNEQHLDFDLELAKAQSADNPVYYVQYAHARVCSVFRQLAEKGLVWRPEAGLASFDTLQETHEQALLRTLARYPETLELAGERRAPHQLVHYVRELANEFHTYYNAHTFLVDDERLREARLALIEATRQVLANGLNLLGVSTPESM